MSKKKKKCEQSRKPLQSRVAITKTYFDDFSNTARKFMLLIGLEASTFDRLSKRTKQYIMITKHTPYRVRAEKGSRVPRSYIQFFNQVVAHYEKTTFYGDPKFNITFREYITCGMTLIFKLRNFNKHEDNLAPDQIELLEKIKDPLLKYTNAHQEDHYAVRANEIARTLFMYVSLPNYRYYMGKEEAHPNMMNGRMENLITVSSIEPERKNFFIDGKIHSSYRLAYYNLFLEAKEPAPVLAEIPMKVLEEENSQTMKQVMNQIKTKIGLPVYIQNHALRRSSERMDCKDNSYRNLIFSLSFLIPKVVTGINGQRLIRALDISGKPIGYFPFIKQDGAVLLLSFLPLSSTITTEGGILHKELGIQLEDSKYIGLDKFSFYTNTDFDTVPKLKQALKKAGMWHLTEIQPNDPTERKEDQILKNFFTEEISIVDEEELVLAE